MAALTHRYCKMAWKTGKPLSPVAWRAIQMWLLAEEISVGAQTQPHHRHVITLEEAQSFHGEVLCSGYQTGTPGFRGINSPSKAARLFRELTGDLFDDVDWRGVYVTGSCIDYCCRRPFRKSSVDIKVFGQDAESLRRQLRLRNCDIDVHVYSAPFGHVVDAMMPSTRGWYHDGAFRLTISAAIAFTTSVICEYRLPAHGQVSAIEEHLDRSYAVRLSARELVECRLSIDYIDEFDYIPGYSLPSKCNQKMLSGDECVCQTCLRTFPRTYIIAPRLMLCTHCTSHGPHYRCELARYETMKINLALCTRDEVVRLFHVYSGKFLPNLDTPRLRYVAACLALAGEDDIRYISPAQIGEKRYAVIAWARACAHNGQLVYLHKDDAIYKWYSDLAVYLVRKDPHCRVHREVCSSRALAEMDAPCPMALSRPLNIDWRVRVDLFDEDEYVRIAVQVVPEDDLIYFALGICITNAIVWSRCEFTLCDRHFCGIEDCLACLVPGIIGVDDYYQMARRIIERRPYKWFGLHVGIGVERFARLTHLAIRCSKVWRASMNISSTQGER